MAVCGSLALFICCFFSLFFECDSIFLTKMSSSRFVIFVNIFRCFGYWYLLVEWNFVAFLFFRCFQKLLSPPPPSLFFYNNKYPADLFSFNALWFYSGVSSSLSSLVESVLIQLLFDCNCLAIFWRCFLVNVFWLPLTVLCNCLPISFLMFCGSFLMLPFPPLPRVTRSRRCDLPLADPELRVLPHLG